MAKMGRATKKLVKKSKLAQLMAQKNLTQYRLAKLMKVTPTTVSGWMNKFNPTAEYCAKLMVLLDCSIWDLLHKFEDKDVIPEEDELEEELNRRLEEIGNNEV